MEVKTIFAYETFQEIACLPVGRFTIFVLLAPCCASLTWAQSSDSFSSFLNPDCAGQENRDHGFAYSERPEGNFYCNPLMLGIKKKI
jgi:hypothetical protein